MPFNSLTFLIFFVIVLVGYYLPAQSWRSKKVCLLFASYIFYASWNPPFVILLWISTAIDWTAAKKIAATQVQIQRRAWVAVSMITNLGLLGFFKYGGFLLDNFKILSQAMGMPFTPIEFSVVLPVGISFYTFQTLSYTLDVYHRRSGPSPSFVNFALYVTFFPQLVAGPIVRATDLIPQFVEERRATSLEFLGGLGLISWGLFQKVIIADNLLSGTADTVFGTKDAPPIWMLDGSVYWADAWLGALAFGGQIFCDFSGYSTIAIGTALCLGFHLPENFHCPYAAIGFSDFWRRWHISLSYWLRDYLYIPLGGNQKGRVREYVNIMVTMLLGGLWHGASWNFVAWGGLHGIYLWIERILKNSFSHTYWVKYTFVQFIIGIGTFLLITITWIFFRAQSWNVAFAIFKSTLFMTPLGATVLSPFDMIKVTVVVIGLVTSHWIFRNQSIEKLIQLIQKDIWVFQRNLVTNGNGKETVILGDSRVQFDLNLEVWKQETGKCPIMLTQEGTAVWPILQDLANEENFKGTLIIGVTEGLLFLPDSTDPVQKGFLSVRYYKAWSPSAQISLALSKLIEPRLAFLNRWDKNLSLFLKNRLTVENRLGGQVIPTLMSLTQGNYLNSGDMLWKKIETDLKFSRRIQQIWGPLFRALPTLKGQQLIDFFNMITSDIRKIQNRGGNVIFIRLPSTCGLNQLENKLWPRNDYYNQLLAHTQCKGYHFSDYDELGKYICPEWSHIKKSETTPFTRSLIQIINQENAKILQCPLS